MTTLDPSIGVDDEDVETSPGDCENPACNADGYGPGVQSFTVELNGATRHLCLSCTKGFLSQLEIIAAEMIVESAEG